MSARQLRELCNGYVSYSAAHTSVAEAKSLSSFVGARETPKLVAACGVALSVPLEPFLVDFLAFAPRAITGKIGYKERDDYIVSRVVQLSWLRALAGVVAMIWSRTPGRRKNKNKK